MVNIAVSRADQNPRVMAVDLLADTCSVDLGGLLDSYDVIVEFGIIYRSTPKRLNITGMNCYIPNS
jgi:hypothetical protein